MSWFPGFRFPKTGAQTLGNVLAPRRSGSGRLTLRELRRGDLFEALEALDKEDDINKVWAVPWNRIAFAVDKFGKCDRVTIFFF